MKKTPSLLIAALMACLLSPAAQADLKGSAHEAKEDIKTAGKKFGEDTREAAHEIGHTAKAAGHAVASGARTGYYATKHAIRRAVGKDGPTEHSPNSTSE